MINIPIIPNIPPRSTPVLPVNPVTPTIPKPTDINEIKNDFNKENLPRKIPVPTREELSIYRPSNQPLPINNMNKQFDKVTGR